MKNQELIGQVFNDWTVVGERTVKKQKSYWLCRCKCGLEKNVMAYDLKNGKSKRCFKCGIEESNKKARSCPLTQTFWHIFKHNAERRNLEIFITKEEAYQLFLEQNGKMFIYWFAIEV